MHFPWAQAGIALLWVCRTGHTSWTRAHRSALPVHHNTWEHTQSCAAPTDTATASSEAPESSVGTPSMGNDFYFSGDQGCPEGMAGAGCRVPCAIAAAQPPPASFVCHQNSWAGVIPALSCGINDSNAGTEIQESRGFTTLLGYFVLFYWGKCFFHVPQDSLL